MIHDNARPHTVTTMQDLIVIFGWEQFNHPHLEPRLSGMWFSCVLASENFPWWPAVPRRQVKEVVNTWFASQASSFYDAGIQKLVPRYNKCLNNDGNFRKVV
jgi:hypothetical protein